MVVVSVVGVGSGSDVYSGYRVESGGCSGGGDVGRVGR